MTSELVFDPQVKVSKKALERSSKFKKVKDEIGIDAILFDSLFPDTRVYFNKHGEITCVTQDDSLIPDPDWLTHDFTSAELALVGRTKGLSKLHVSKIDKGYEIIVATIKKSVGIVQGSDLFLVDEKVDDADILVQVNPENIVVSTTPDMMTELCKNNYTHNNHKVLSFYVTLTGNPHYMVYNFYVPLSDLATKGSVKIPVEENYALNSIYTKPVFDTYGRV